MSIWSSVAGFILAFVRRVYRLWKAENESVTLRVPPMPAGRREVRLTIVEGGPSGGPNIPTQLSLATSPNPGRVGQVVTAYGRLTRADTGEGLPNQAVIIETSPDGVTWTPKSVALTDANGNYAAPMTFDAPGDPSVRPRFPGGPEDGPRRA